MMLCRFARKKTLIKIYSIPLGPTNGKSVSKLILLVKYRITQLFSFSNLKDDPDQAGSSSSSSLESALRPKRVMTMSKFAFLPDKFHLDLGQEGKQTHLLDGGIKH